MYDNESRLWLYEDDIMRGHWLTDEDGELWIIPIGICDDIIGPDGQVRDALSSAYHAHGHITESDCTTLGLIEVPRILRRFDPQEGYYHA